MISFRNVEHHKQHCPQHKELCSVICKILEKVKGHRFFCEFGGSRAGKLDANKDENFKLIRSKEQGTNV